MLEQVASVQHVLRLQQGVGLRAVKMRADRRRYRRQESLRRRRHSGYLLRMTLGLVRMLDDPVLSVLSLAWRW